MKAILIFDTHVTQKVIRRIANVKSEKLVIVTDKNVYYKLKEIFKNYHIENIDLMSEVDSYKKIAISETISKSIESIHINSSINYSKLSKNKIFDNLVRILYNLFFQLEVIIEKYYIDEINLYEGNPRTEFVSIILSEGERAFRYFYRRSWYLNNYVFKYFGNRINIIWENQTPSFLIKSYKKIRTSSVLFGKLGLLALKIIRSRIFNTFPKGNEYALLSVRSPIQVDPLLPIYFELLNNHISPIFICQENYSNNGLIKIMKSKGLNFIDLYSHLNLKELIKIYIKLIKVSNSINKEESIFFGKDGNEIEISLSQIVNELMVYWIDMDIRYLLLNKVKSIFSRDLTFLFNCETGSHYSAIDAMWAESNNISSVGIQHVAIATDEIKPKICWTDVMFMMSKDIAIELTKTKPDENLVYLGPVAYDLFFNSTMHENEFNSITIFTQPDDYKSEYFRIIEDVIDIINKNNLMIELNVKLHPREKDVSSFKKYTLKYDKVNLIVNEITSSELIANSDLVISISSGILMQSIIIGTPSISVNYNNKYPTNLDFIRDDVTKKVFSRSELDNSLNNLNELNLEYNINRNKYVNKKFGAYDGNSAREVIKYLKTKEIK